MKKQWSNPPKDKKQIRKKEEKYSHLRKAKDYNNNSQFKHRFNKAYKREFKLDEKYQYFSSVKKYLTTYKIYKSIDFLTKKGYFEIDYIGKRKIIPSEQVIEELFRRELCVFRDTLIWENDKKREYAKRKKYHEKRRIKPFYIILPSGEKFCFGKFDVKRAKLAESVAMLLLNNIYIFDKESEFYMKPSQIRKMVNEKMHTRHFEKANFKELVLKYQKC
jgi:hypothetical protein